MKDLEVFTGVCLRAGQIKFTDDLEAVRAQLKWLLFPCLLALPGLGAGRYLESSGEHLNEKATYYIVFI